MYSNSSHFYISALNNCKNKVIHIINNNSDNHLCTMATLLRTGYIYFPFSLNSVESKYWSGYLHRRAYHPTKRDQPALAADARSQKGKKSKPNTSFDCVVLSLSSNFNWYYDMLPSQISCPSPPRGTKHMPRSTHEILTHPPRNYVFRLNGSMLWRGYETGNMFAHFNLWILLSQKGGKGSL